jgi:CheY-like chemotaxis protein/DNA-binding XRE family transcriptional regulator
MPHNSEKNNQLDVFVGEGIRNIRTKAGLTLSDLANKIGISHQQIQKYENGQSRVSANCLFQLAQVFGVTPDYFFKDYFEQSTKKIKSFDEAQTINLNRTRKLNILIVEDSPSDELLVRKVLENHKNVSFFCVHDGLQMLELLKNKSLKQPFPRPDIILLDLNIPKRNGHELLKEIKRDRLLQDIPIIIISNSINFKDLLNAYKGFAAGYICKSFSFEEFTKNINGMVDYWMNIVCLPNNVI